VNAVACRSCGGSELHSILSLGSTPLANSLVRDPAAEAAAEPRYPLELVFCPACLLVQITETVPPEVLFRDYLYFSSFSDTMLAHARELTGRMTAALALDARSLAVEIASNDGYLLQYYKQAGVPVMGIEPARNIAKVAVDRGIPTLPEFFGLQLATELAADRKRADVLHANNVLAHVADLNGFVAGIHAILADEGVAALEFPYLGDMIDHCEFDTIYHEHLCYFSLGAIKHLFERHHMRLLAVERLPIHGGSLLLQVVRAGSKRAPDASVQALLAEEDRRGMGSVEFYRGFARRVLELKGRCWPG
jgi:hypothetical protein